MLKEQALSYTELVVQRGPYHISAREYPGEEPPIVLMHGFPDNVHLYDRLLLWLSPSRRVVTFDFLGWGASDLYTPGRSCMNGAEGGERSRSSASLKRGKHLNYFPLTCAQTSPFRPVSRRCFTAPGGSICFHLDATVIPTPSS